jgi:hypothetical protein
MDREILVRDSAYHSVNRPMARTSRANDRRSSSRRQIDGKSFRLVDEVRYIQQHAAAADGRVFSLGQLMLFSTGTGDAWLPDRSDQLTVRLARDGRPEPVDIQESDANFAVTWKGHCRIDGAAFIYLDLVSGKLATILGYPTSKLGPAG